MFKINRTTEYGLIALQHMSRKHSTPTEATAVTSAREVADSYGLPFEITAKTLQRLKDTGVIQSAQGARGGYALKRQLDDITLAEFLSLMEGPQSVVVCASSGSPTASCQCEYERNCEIKLLMHNLNSRVFRFLTEIRLSELIVPPPATVELNTMISPSTTLFETTGGSAQ